MFCHLYFNPATATASVSAAAAAAAAPAAKTDVVGSWTFCTNEESLLN